MSLDKAIKHGKEKRKPYYGSKVFDCTCRNHGTCVVCLNNRLHKYKRRGDGLTESKKMILKNAIGSVSLLGTDLNKLLDEMRS